MVVHGSLFIGQLKPVRELPHLPCWYTGVEHGKTDEISSDIIRYNYGPADCVASGNFCRNQTKLQMTSSTGMAIVSRECGLEINQL